jgi:hypothetical protein
MAQLKLVVVRSLKGASPAAIKAALGDRVKTVGELCAGGQSVAAIARKGADEIHLIDGKGKHHATAWLDPTHERGVVFDVANKVVICWVKRGQAVPFLKKLPADIVSALKRIGTAKAPSFEKLTARHVRTVGSRADAAALPAIEKAQLTAAASQLSGKRGLPALFAACDAAGRGLELVRVSSAKSPRFDAWVWASLEDGVLFEHGSKRFAGLAISQHHVHATVSKREADVAAVQTAWKKLKLPRPSPWRE